MEFEFKFRIGDLVLRSYDDRKKYTTAKIMYWEQSKDDGYSLAYWDKNNFGYYLKFVEDRPLTSVVEIESFLTLVKMGQDILNNIFTNKED